MKFKETLLQGSLIKRYKRFFIDIKFQNKTITAHCPNPGSMKGLLEKGNKIYFSKSNNIKRKLKYTAHIIKSKKNFVGINTLLTNKIVLEALVSNQIEELKKFKNIRPEAKFSNHTRFDFLISNNKKECFLEVKNVTLSRKSGIAEFPDSITSRGTKHLNELINAKKMGFESYILYLIQRDDCDSFKIAEDIDQEYKFAFDRALENNVKIICYNCKLSNKEIKLNKKIIYEKGL